MFQFDQPWMLLTALPAWVIYRRLAAANGLRGAVRLSLLFLLVIIMAGPVGPAIQQPRTLVLIFDQSRSMPPAIQQHKARLLAEARAQMSPSDRLGVVVFGGNALVEQFPDPDRPPQTILGTPLNHDQSNLHSAVATALDLVPEESPGQILLVSDGRSDDSLSDELRGELRRRSIPVHFQVFQGDDQSQFGDVALESVRAPHAIELGADLVLEYEIVAQMEYSATLGILRDDTLVASRELKCSAGTTKGTWTTRCDEVGAFRYSISVQVTGDPQPGNNTWDTWVRVGRESPVLVISSFGIASPMAKLLRTAGLPVVAVAADQYEPSLEKLSTVSGCVLENVDLRELQSGAVERLAAYVDRLGGGLMVTGGERSFGVGGYRSSPIDPLLPVALRPLNVAERPPHALALVVNPAAWDAQNFDADNLTPIQKALLGLVGEMDPADRIAIVATQQPETVVLPLAVATKKDVRDTIHHLGFSSDPAVFPRALEAAWDILANAPLPAKHLLVLVETDQLDSWPPRTLDPRHIKPIQGATITVITWGTPHEGNLLNWKNKVPEAQFYSTSTIEELTQLLQRDWELNTGSSYVTRQVAIENHPDSAAFPPASVSGYHTATLREAATAVIFVKGLPSQPLIARWQRSLGRVVAVLFPVSANDNPTAQAIGNLIAEQLRWATNTRDKATPLAATIDTSGRVVTVRISDGGQAAPMRAGKQSLELEVVHSDGTLSSRVPFLDQDELKVAEFELDCPQTHLPIIRLGDSVVARGTPVTMARSAELLPGVRAESGRNVLIRLASESGGAEWPSGLPLLDSPPSSFRNLVPFFAWCAIALLLLDIADRRFQLIGNADAFIENWRVQRQPRPSIDRSNIDPNHDPFIEAKERVRRRIQR